MLNTFLDWITTLKKRFDGLLKIDISVLLILCVITQHSFLLKAAGLFLVVLINLRELQQVKIKELPLFYLVLPLMELLRFLLFNRDFSAGHMALFAVGMSYWLAALLVCAILYENVKRDNTLYVTRSIGVYTLLNFVVSLIQYVSICIHEQVLNPYNTGHDHPYGISSGDLIHGLSGEVHIVNAFVSLFLVIYYVSRRRAGMVLLALVPLLLTGSNYATILLMAGLFLYWLFSGNRKQIGLLSMVVSVTVFFYVFLTTENAKYLSEKLLYILVNRPIAAEQYEGRADTGGRVKQDSIAADMARIQVWVRHNVNEQFEFSLQQKAYKGVRYNFQQTSGKKTAYVQTVQYLQSGWSGCLFGTGMGGFSSKLAFNFSGVMDQSSIGKYLPHYETGLFRDHHKSIYADLKTRHVIMHSESNRPFSTYNQLLGEYGVLGLLCFFFLYIGYFLRRVQIRGYALPMIAILLLMLHLDYFIESLNLLLFFELLLFLNIREQHASVTA